MVPCFSDYEFVVITSANCKYECRRLWVQGILSRGGGENLFNPGLMNKLIRTE